MQIDCSDGPGIQLVSKPPNARARTQLVQGESTAHKRNIIHLEHLSYVHVFMHVRTLECAQQVCARVFKMPSGRRWKVDVAQFTTHAGTYGRWSVPPAMPIIDQQ